MQRCTRCKDARTTYFPGISTADDTWTKEELEKIGLENQKEAKRQYAEWQAEKNERMAKYSLDPKNKQHYRMQAEKWKKAVTGNVRVWRSRPGIAFQRKFIL